ncbi:unnamed protein product [Discula destructiva]
MATKRHLGSITEPDGDSSSPAPSTKRARNSNGPHQKKSHKQQQQSEATDVTYGQRYCFSSVHETMSDEDLEFEDETDALAYLQSVRHEASAIPHLLVAPKSGPKLPGPQDDDGDDNNHATSADDDNPPIDRSIYHNGHGDARGYYKDGAYTAAPSTSPPSFPSSSSPHSAIDTAYFARLITSFHRLRTTLHQTPPPDAIAHLSSSSSDHTPYVGTFGAHSRTFALWSARLRTTDPHPAQVAAMDKAAVLRLLRVLLGGKFLRSGGEVHERTSRWLWALLARLPDRGEMDHLEVGHVRDLGKRAALLMHTLKEMAALREEVELGGHDGDGDGEVWVGRGEGEHDDEDEDDDEDIDDDDEGAAEQDGATVEGGDVAGEDGEVRADHDKPVVQADNDDAAADPSSSAPDGLSEEVAAQTVMSASRPEPTPTPLRSTSDNTPHQPSTAPISADGKAAPATANDDDVEEGEIADESEPMDLEAEAEPEDFESAKARLLANVENATTDGGSSSEVVVEAPTAATAVAVESDDKKKHTVQQAEDENEDEDKAPAFDPVRSRMNMRATLNMILTVAGEFYGQRDLLEFRDPFHGV